MHLISNSNQFWDAANLYRNLKPTEFKVKSQELYDKFIKKGAPRQINLPAHILEELIMVMGKQQVCLCACVCCSSVVVKFIYFC